MRLEWLDDILGVAETGSFSEAAERRGLTQSAFSRRIRLIEERVGVELFDRTRKPVALRATTEAQRETMVRLAGELRDLMRNLRDGAGWAGQSLVVASQHALTATRAAALVTAIHGADASIRVALVTANLDDCFAQLLARRADIAIVYRHAGAEPPVRPDFVEIAELGVDRLVPVIATAQLERLKDRLSRGDIPYVAYPREVFFGRVLDHVALRRLREIATPRSLAETALTIAALEMARAGIAVAWVPKSLADDDLQRGRLQDLSDRLPSAPLDITMVRLRGEARPTVSIAWNILAGARPERG